MSLLDSNRNKKNVEPLKSANISDLQEDKKTTNKVNQSKDKNVEEKQGQVGYKTSLTVDSKVRNMIHAMVLLGDAPNQKEGMSIAMHMYYDNLPDDKKSMFDLFYKSIENNDNVNSKD
ncbi:DUF5388 domain-containing protein [Lactobacillaceae bacterium Scapto_B20]